MTAETHNASYAAGALAAADPGWGLRVRRNVYATAALLPPLTIWIAQWWAGRDQLNVIEGRTL